MKKVYVVMWFYQDSDFPNDNAEQIEKIFLTEDAANEWVSNQISLDKCETLRVDEWEVE